MTATHEPHTQPRALPTETPPGPKLPMAIQTWRFGRHRHEWLPALRERYGDVFTLDIYPDRNLVQLANPEDIRTVFSGPASRFHAGEGNMILAPIMGERSVLTTDENVHKRLRTLLMPAFHGSALRGYRTMVERLALQEIAQWPIGTRFETHERMQALTLEIIMRVVFGVAEGPRLDALRTLLGKLVSSTMLTFLGLQSPRLRRLPPWRKTVAMQREIDTLLAAEIRERRRVPDLADRKDVLSQMISVDDDGDRLTDEELRDQLITLLLAGHETTATALSWCFHELARDPERQRLGREAALSGDDKYLEAIFKEALRLRPVIYEVARKLTEDIEIGGYRIPAGYTVMPIIGVVQSDAKNHEDPEAFRPERFLGSSPAPNTWIPFGGGIRRCLGAGFAQMEGVEVLRAALSHYTFTADRAAPEPPTPRNITLTPRRGGRIIAWPV
ncbi:cytochrome P450 [Hoyosella sp. YIM 151337]|uniref:cytochrome P450 n=1 Tax=Hoyosella sp. YIM 151337 TaxID=2992742 RepID=UPI002235C75A|nr:cytochrome P450 [Hoyosella sp. YIM 151337]MCW4354403.1 cytochrome P450 [Hoyosella sp. YIM 151337]